ncbi:DUF6602 domain-containing protein [Pseudomonas sp. SDO528_S397]|jgi:hypothetical protein|nr:DUF6602 domain-containing protein [Pseudomonas alliivorans]MEE4649306.1 DUF6602 domain-containing protein [Pseudomonas alliivorans]
MKVLAEILRKLYDQKIALLNGHRSKQSTLTGSMYEGLTIELLEKVDLSRYGVKVVSGVITSGDEESEQIDCMVVVGEGTPFPCTPHFSYPMEQVVAVFEVKKTLYSTGLNKAYGQLEEVFQLSKRDYQRREAQGTLEFSTRRPAQEFLSLFGEWPCHYEENAKLTFNQRVVYHSLVRDRLTPLRIAIGYNGYKTEKGLRDALYNLYRDNEEVEGYGVINMPNLMISEGYSVIKLNGMPYKGIWNEESEEWCWLGSSSVDPMLLILELLYDRVELMLGIELDRGDDQGEEPSFPLMVSKPMARPGAAQGWIHQYIDAPIPKQDPQQRIWAPLKISTAEKEFLKLLDQQGPQLAGSEKLVGFMDEHEIEDIRESMRTLFATRIVLQTDDVFCICAGHWVVAKVGGEFYCGDNAGQRFEKWLSKHNVATAISIKDCAD